MKTLRVLLADDHALFRAGIAALVDAESDMEVVGEAGTGEEAVARAVALRPDVITMDLSMPGCGGLEATQRIASACPDARVLVVTMHAEEEYLVPVLEAGASGYVTKSSADRELMDAIRAVARGEVFLYPSGARLLLQNLRSGDASESPLARLSAREREVLALTAGGYSSTEIGERLQISPKTVDTYRARIMEKLDLHHRSDLIHFALRVGLLSAAGPRPSRGDPYPAVGESTTGKSGRFPADASAVPA